MTENNSELTRQPVKELSIRSERFPDGYSNLHVRIDQQGNLVLDAVYAGPTVERMRGDWDYEYSVTVPATWKDTVLLHLMKDRFAFQGVVQRARHSGRQGALPANVVPPQAPPPATH
jgi:hypothetical protein